MIGTQTGVKPLLLLVCVFLWIAPASSQPADAAASSPRPSDDIEEIRIEGEAGRGIEETQASSAVQFDSSELEALGIEDVSDLASFTPNLQIVTASSTAASFYIRGVGLTDFSANAAGAVAVYVDDVPLNSPALQVSQIFDAQNILILRGPQGSGAGRNASAGAIKIYSTKPSGDFGGYLRSSQGSYVSDDAIDALIQDYEGAVGVPLVADVLASRFSFRLRQADPFMINGCGGAAPLGERPRNVPICGENLAVGGDYRIPGGLPSRVGDRNVWAARGQFLFTAPADLLPNQWDGELLLNLHGSRLDQNSTLGQAIGTVSRGLAGANARFGTRTGQQYQDPDQTQERDDIYQGLLDQGVAETEAKLQTNTIFERILAQTRPLDRGPYRGDYNRVGQTTLDTWGGYLRAELLIGNLEFLSVTGYDAYDRFRDTDSDYTPARAFEVVQQDQSWQITQDFQVHGELEDYPVRWEVGAFLLKEKIKADVVVFTRTFQSLRDYAQESLSYGVFAGVTWDFLDDFTLDAGVRWNSETKEFNLNQQNEIFPGFFIPALPSVEDRKVWQAPTGTISLTYSLSEEVSMYWKYSRGWKGGHFNTNSVKLPNNKTPQPATPEFLDSFEWGVDGSFFDGTLSVRSALFFYDYEDYQVFQFEGNGINPPSLQIVNANDAEVLGVELDLTWLPLAGRVPEAIEGLSLEVRSAWLASEFKDFTNTVFRRTPSADIFPVKADYSGNQLINSPEFEVNGSVSWEVALGRYGSITPRYDVRWIADVPFDANESFGLIGYDGRANKPRYALGQKAFWLHSVRLSYRSADSTVELAGWCRNLLDERYKNYAFDVSDFQSQTINSVGDPRTCGGDVRFTF